MKTVLLILISILVFPSLIEAKTSRFRNKLRVDREVESFYEKVDDIPVYRERIEGNYDILGHVHAQDVFTNKIEGMVRNLRVQTYKIGGDAVMELRCERILKSMVQQCEGFVIKHK